MIAPKSMIPEERFLKEMSPQDWQALLQEIEDTLGRVKRLYIEHRVKTLEQTLELGRDEGDSWELRQEV